MGGLLKAASVQLEQGHGEKISPCSLYSIQFLALLEAMRWLCLAVRERDGRHVQEAAHAGGRLHNLYWPTRILPESVISLSTTMHGELLESGLSVPT